MSISKFFLFSFVCVLSFILIYLLSHYLGGNEILKEDEISVLKVCSDVGYVPFEMVNHRGEWDGYEIKIIAKFASENNYKVEFKNMAYDGLIPSLNGRKDCDIIASTLAVNMERGNSVEFSKPILNTYFSAIVRSEDIGKFNSFDKINQKDVLMAVQNGTENLNYVSKYIKNVMILGYSNNIDPVLAVLTHKADIYIEDINYLRIMQKKYLQKLKLINEGILINNPHINIAFALRKKDTKLIKKINDYIQKISDNTELDKLKKDYFEDLIWIHRFPI